ncbi:MAG: glutamate 5-kinase [Persephonella sp.]|nr:MAG: glutamate 5-kinase [Persephonella sp.]
MSRDELLKKAKRIVIKLGSQIIASDSRIDENFIKNLAAQIKNLKDKEFIIVSSGAVLSGLIKLGLKTKPKNITEKQALASVGQAYLIQIYDKIFSEQNLNIGQILLTIEGLQERKRYILAKNTINKLLEMGIIPIINENDTVGVEEIVFGDNDFLASHVAVLTDADLLIILSTAGGLYTGEPSDKTSKLIDEITDINDVLKYAGSSKSKYGTGGMRSKLEASQLSISHGIPVVIAPKEENIISDILSGRKIGSFIYPQKNKLSKKKSWIKLLSSPKGKVIVDFGAETAIRDGKSLLPTGIVDIEGIFNEKDVVVIQNLDGKIIGKGIVNYNYKELKKIKGLKSEEIKKKFGRFTEAIHRDNLVIFD